MFCTTARRFSILFMIVGLHLTRIGSLDASAHANVSLRMLNGNLPVVSASVNGRGPIEFVIDTGTNTTLIDPGLAIRLRLDAIGNKTLTTLSGSVNAPRYLLDALTVGGASRFHLEALAQPMTQLQLFDPDIQGIIGLDFLSAFSFRIDYKHLQLELYAADQSPGIIGGVRVPARFAADRILVRAVSLDARQGVWRLALDSGISQLLIFENRLARAELSPRPPGSGLFRSPSSAFAEHVTKPLATNLSSTTAMAIALHEVGIGNLNLVQVPTIILPAPSAALAAYEDGLLPACFFDAVFVDRLHSAVIFNPD